MQLIEMFESGLSSLRHIHNQLRADAVKLLEEEASHLEAVLLEVHEKLLPVYLNSEPKQETFQAEGEHLSDDNECKDVHITDDVVTDISSKVYSKFSFLLIKKQPDAYLQWYNATADWTSIFSWTMLLMFWYRYSKEARKTTK